jgi:hypothetical protein
LGVTVSSEIVAADPAPIGFFATKQAAGPPRVRMISHSAELAAAYPQAFDGG